MKPVIPFLLAAAAALCACAHAPADAFPDSRAGAGGVQPADRMAAIDGQRDIVIAVANPVSPPAPHAASNVLGYGTADQYRNGQRAMSTLDELKRQYRLREIVGWPIKPLGLYCAVLRPASGTDRDALLKALSADARVRIAERLQEYDVYAGQPGEMRYDDPYVRLQRGFAEIDAPLAQQSSQGRGVDVALVDTGVDLAHPDLKDRIRGAYNMVDDDAAAFRRDLHGTEVAGVIAAAGGNKVGIVGIAPQARLSAYKACWHPAGAGSARCNTFTLAKALAALIDTDTRIINMSLGGPPDLLLEQLLAVLLRQDRIVVAAMPPDGRVAGFPAATPGVIVVRSAQARKAPAGVVDAPGTDILTTQPDGRYGFASGSSLAAAHVSGIAALLLSLAPALDAREVRAILERSSMGPGGNRQVNAAAAIAALPGARSADPRKRTAR
ncbi:S8 family serine peptidase [Pseudoxanthomonas sangjuensis]|uniref:S8 family peptidase n=1 Tax=Pseudoxanthomonas sangjuensis TaxID=1503750 RepID=UPI001391AFEB|nr:S8 family serine peptidase [Pseudoxanthomonas sangjuensis]KAF1714515.1 serine protease [Pseudoxanthomonas sangjuensis]